jgi:RNA recognition motif-containing protein
MAPSTTEQVDLSARKSKKDKSRKKRKIEDLEDSLSVKDNSATGDVQSSAPASASASASPDVSSEDVFEGEEPAKKRKKIDVEEIEVDITKPEPPSKKALRALKKGKPLPPTKSGAESTPEPEETTPKKEVEKRSEYGIWIGNMAFHTTKEDLRTFLIEKSDLTSDMITRIHMPGPNDKKSANKVESNKHRRSEHNKGFAYVDFSTARGVEIALELSEELLSGRRVLIKDAKSYAGRPEKTKEEQRQDGKAPSKRIFIGNLAYDNTEDSLKEHFEKCGAVESVKVATFEDSGKCKGFAWVVFEELEAAQHAVKGFVMIEEELSDEDSESDGSDSEGDEDMEKKVKPRNIKRRKWWVNKIKGRPLRVEFAEDAQTRYKKRYGKDGTKNTQQNNGTEAGAIKPTKVVEYRNEYAPRLTGGIVESKGTKVTF